MLENSLSHVVDNWDSLDEKIVACDKIIVSDIDLINFCMVEGLYKLLSVLPS